MQKENNYWQTEEKFADDQTCEVGFSTHQGAIQICTANRDLRSKELPVRDKNVFTNSSMVTTTLKQTALNMFGPYILDSLKRKANNRGSDGPSSIMFQEFQHQFEL